MRIAQIATLAESIPPQKYGGTERVVHTITEELVKRGHTVTLFATGDSQTSAHLVSVYPEGLRAANKMKSHGSLYSLLNSGLAYARQEEFDIIHDHNVHFSLPTANIATTPTVATLHGPFDEINRPYFQNLRNNIHLVAISQAQADRAPELEIPTIIHNGLDMQEYPFEHKDDGYLLFVGRLSEEKGIHFAIRAAQVLHMPLILAAKLDPGDTKYFKEQVEPHLSDQIRWIGEVNEFDRNALMSKARCMLHPTNWPEPFGLTLIEAMGCGCPVVAFEQGSIPEIIRNGRTGFIVPRQDVGAMVSAIQNIGFIKRKDCRNHALTHFSGKRMTDDYEDLYETILKQKRRTQAETLEKHQFFIN